MLQLLCRMQLLFRNEHKVYIEVGGCRYIETRKDVDLVIPLILNHFSPNVLLILNTGLLVKKTANINVKNYISLKHGVYRPDSTYKTAKMIYQNYSH